jgi:hypothetical protein
MNIPVQTLGGSVAVLVWWAFGVWYPDIKVTSEAVAASVVIWQMLMGLFAVLLQKILGGNVVQIDNSNGKH